MNITVNRSKLFVFLAAALFTLPAGAADIQATGIPNFHQVNGHLYRGGQPDDAAWPSLAKLGVKTVIDLRPATEHSLDQEEKAVEAAGMRYISEPLSGVAAPTSESILKILTLLDSSADGPVFVHCRRGADRTGTVIACYRIARNQWTNQDALNEARSYGMSRMEIGMRHFIHSFHFDPLPAQAGVESEAGHD
jgi:tyrosine-protein phosphatase SIW14